ncbi:MAG: flagellar biosynthetic protein FliR [Gemmatimonadetes bacterium]|nr:flagellar biosynthetic protein FliR [Gemmatimonadota bacterium]
MDALSLFEWTSGRFILVFMRLATLLALAPFYGFKNVSVRVRIGLALLIALILTPVVDVPDLEESPLSQFVLLGLKEIAIGGFLGFALSIVFAAAQFAGHIAGFQMGLAMANTVDPQGQVSLSVVGEFFYVLAVLLFLVFDGHLFVLKTVVHSFELVPVDAFSLNGGAMRHMVRLTSDLFGLAVQLAAPVIAALFATSVTLGLIARTVPQMNVFIVGFPIKIGLGFFACILCIPFFAHAFGAAWSTLQRDAVTLLAALSGV